MYLNSIDVPVLGELWFLVVWNNFRGFMAYIWATFDSNGNFTVFSIAAVWKVFPIVFH